MEATDHEGKNEDRQCTLRPGIDIENWGKVCIALARLTPEDFEKAAEVVNWESCGAAMMFDVSS